MLRCYHPTVKISTAYSGFGGSTISLAELCNAFNRWGVRCSIYGSEEFLMFQTKFAEPYEDFIIRPNDRVIQHLMECPQGIECKKIVLSCHEKSRFSLRYMNTKGYDHIRFVSEDQKNWQSCKGTVIPNLIEGIEKVVDPPSNVAGVIGSISPRKRTHRAVCQAIADGYDEVWVFGPVEKESYYFRNYIRKLLQLPQVKYKGMESDRNKIYSSVSVVYHSGEDESACRVYGECKKAGIPFKGNLPDYELWDEERIRKAWFELLDL